MIIKKKVINNEKIIDKNLTRNYTESTNTINNSLHMRQ